MKKFVVVLTIVLLFTGLYAADQLKGALIGVPKASDSKEQGWFPSLVFKGIFMFNNVQHISGQTDGNYLNIGLKADFNMDMLIRKHEWRTHFFVNEGFSHTPVLDRFVKGNDEMVLNSIYLYNISDFWGPFVQFHGDTNLAPGYEARENATTFVMPGNGLDRKVTNNLEMNPSFAPVILKEVGGLFVRPLRKDWMMIEFLGGVGGYHYMVHGNTYQIDEERDGRVYLKNVQTFHQFGGEASLTFSGKFRMKTDVDYKAWALMFVPFVYTEFENDNQGIGDLMNYEFGANVAISAAKWLAINYEFKAEWTPQLIEEWQIKNQLMITLIWKAIKDKREKE